MAEWWINNSNDNLLKGVWGDDDNLPRLSDEYILDFLRRIPAARASFNTLIGSMLPEEQERLRALAQNAEFLMADPKAVEDKFQAALNKTGVRTTGRYGGTRMGGNN